MYEDQRHAFANEDFLSEQNLHLNATETYVMQKSQNSMEFWPF